MSDRGAPRDVEREVIYACTLDLTNSNGNTDIPLSSYGLYRNLKGDVRSDCAPQAPCLEFNKLFAGPLEVIAKQCGFADKLARLVSETPFLEFVREGSQCQHARTTNARLLSHRNKQVCLMVLGPPGAGVLGNG